MASKFPFPPKKGGPAPFPPAKGKKKVLPEDVADGGADDAMENSKGKVVKGKQPAGKKAPVAKKGKGKMPPWLMK